MNKPELPPSFDKVLELFRDENVILSSKDVVRLTGLSPKTSREVLARLTETKQIDCLGYKQRYGYMYAPVSDKTFRLRFGDEYYTVEGLVNYLASTTESPYPLLLPTGDKWDNFKRLILRALFADNPDARVPIEQLRNTFEQLSKDANNLTRLAASLCSEDFWNGDGRTMISSELESVGGAWNYYRDFVLETKKRSSVSKTKDAA